MRFILAARSILGWSEVHLAQRLNVPVEEVVLVETMSPKAKEDVCERAVRILMAWVAKPALFRGARGLLGDTQNRFAVQAEISPNTYSKFENESFEGPSAFDALGSLAKVLAFLAAKGVTITFSEESGMGVAWRELGSESLIQLRNT